MGDARFQSGQLWLEWSGVGGQPVMGAYRLRVIGMATMSGFPVGAAVLLQGQLSVEATAFMALAPLQPTTLVVGYPPPQFTRPNGPDRLGSRTLELVADLTPIQLETLEERRRGGDLRFTIDVVVTLLNSQSSEHPEIRLQDNLHVSRRDWAQVLEQWGRGVAFSVMVPLPTYAGGSLRHRAAEHLKTAQHALDDGRIGDAVGALRNVAYLVCRLNPSFGKRLPQKRADRNKEQRFLALANELRSLTSAAHHPDSPTTEDFEWQRRDAVAAMGIAAALLLQLD